MKRDYAITSALLLLLGLAWNSPAAENNTAEGPLEPFLGKPVLDKETRGQMVERVRTLESLSGIGEVTSLAAVGEGARV